MMRTRFSILCLLLAGAASAVSISAQAPTSARLAREAVPAAASVSDRAIADEIIRLVKAQWAAQATKNVAAGFQNVAPDYTEFNETYATRIDGRDMAIRMATAGYRGDGTRIMDEMSNPLVQVYGNTAIVSYNFAGSVMTKDGKVQANRAKSTRVYVKQGTEWMMVHANFGSDPAPK